MIHSFTLPPATLDRLSQLVEIQTASLEYAAQTVTLSKSDFTLFLANQWPTKTPPHNKEVANWVLRGIESNQPTLIKAACLKKFASKGTSSQKQQLVDWLKAQFARFEAGKGEMETTTEFAYSHTLPTQILDAAWEFLGHFYEELDGNGVTEKLFTNPSTEAERFSRKDIFKSIRKENPTNKVCVACDVNQYFDRHKKKQSQKREVVGKLDHYFPKNPEMYPYLACHPRNLVPICGNCNEEKSDKDPLSATTTRRLDLAEVFLPYRDIGFCLTTKLKVVLDSNQAHQAMLGPIEPETKKTTQSKIDTLVRLYDVPSRWNITDDEETDQVGALLLKKIRHYLSGRVRAGNLNSINRLLKEQVKDFIDLYGEEMDMYVMRWWLQALIEDQVKRNLRNSSTSPLLKEIFKWFPPRAVPLETQIH